MASYINKNHIPNNQFSQQILNCDRQPIEYKGYLIYERIKSVVFDIVKDGICLSMYAGINGAKKAIDNNEI